MRFFNTAGPIDPSDHYYLSPLQRADLAELTNLIDNKRYFILHAPRQTGKTSMLLALMHKLNAEGRYHALYFNVESAQAMREDVSAAIRVIVSNLASNAKIYLKDTFLSENVNQIWQNNPSNALEAALTEWCLQLDKPLILFIDEIDSLIGDTLISVLRQLRSGYTNRPQAFPQSLILCGVRDVRDYRIHSSRSQEIITGGSAFNVKAVSIRLQNFSQADIKTLYLQHTEATGQAFADDVWQLVWHYTEGQPWLVNALAYEVTHTMVENRDRSITLTAEIFRQAKENLILRRETHLDQLVDKLQESRVQHVISPMLRGEDLGNVPPDDVQYVLDLGLIAKDGQGLKIANAIYQEVIPRELTYIAQINFASHYQPAWYVDELGKIDMDKLLTAFQQFFREHSESWLERFDYKEAGPQLLLQAFLQRIINGGGRIEREYGLGRGRTDLFLIWPYPGGEQREVLELKIQHKSLEKTIEQGLAQTWAYTDRSQADRAHLIIFNRDEDIPWADKIFRREETYRGLNISVWGM